MTQPRPPLDGIRVLDLATFIAAPLSATILSEFGAEVIKIEQPLTGDPLRRFGTPSAEGADTFCWLSEARNKRSLTLDLRVPEGAAILKELVAQSDVVCENFRPGTLEKWGLGYEDLKVIKPDIIMLRVSGYGQDGPNRNRPGFARIAHAFGGLAHLTGEDGGPPLTPGSTSLADYVTGVYGAVGLLLALRARDQDGVGQYIDLALYEPVLRILDDMVPAYAAFGTVRGPQGRGTSNACPHGQFRTKDGWVAIACTNDRMFARLAEAMGHPDLATPERFGAVAVRLAHSAEVDAMVQTWTLAMTSADLVEWCAARDVPCAQVNTVADICADPHIAARQNLIQLPHEGLGQILVPNVLPRLSATPGSVRSAGPALGADTAAAGAGHAALRLLSGDPSFRQRLRANVKRLRDGLRGEGFDLADTPVPIVTLRDAGRDLTALVTRLAARDIVVKLTPASGYSDAPDTATLRIAVFSEHSPQQVDRLIQSIAELA
ncbi:MAG: carnitine dehydratase [Cypionkella sp.]|uniref:CoA transferase n=1 Tax=Cypionkella sp. TaxID=2811411 RepID=UPI002622044A|nr:CoA transferase [Cypionkella sp.]MDB5661160.1 carnitine dehydratase [Cypionkella sp.]